MANTEGPEGRASGEPPAAWVWSQYRAESSAAPETAPETTPAAAPAPTKSSGMIGLGLAAAVLVVAGLTWLFTTEPASGPTEPSELPKPAAVEKPAAPGKAEAEPRATTPAATVTQEAPKAAAAPAPEPARKKKRKNRRSED